jgi:hypothetical protein
MLLKRILRVLPLVFVIILAVFLWEKFKNFSFFKDASTETTHMMVLEKISTLGKLELAKYTFKDIVEQKIIQDFLPDPKALLIVYGEAVGCIDLSQIKKEDIVFDEKNVIIHLPEPEICNYKIDHAKSKIFQTEYAFMNEALLLDEAYKKAEVQILETAKESGILDQTKKNAELVLKPILAEITQKNVVLQFDLKADLKRLK